MDRMLKRNPAKTPKLVAQIPIDSKGWNGTYNGKTLPSDDYWYNITLIPSESSEPNIMLIYHLKSIF